jgi:hypothetical protein
VLEDGVKVWLFVKKGVDDLHLLEHIVWVKLQSRSRVITAAQFHQSREFRDCINSATGNIPILNSIIFFL